MATTAALKCPVCDRSYGGKTARVRLNAHCKELHLEYYRTHIRPLKSPRDINRDSYQRQKLKNPEKVKRDRILARLRKKARSELVQRILRAPPPKSPPLPGSTDIDPFNPYFVVEYMLRIFVGTTVSELLSFDLVSTLETHLGHLEKEIDVPPGPNNEPSLKTSIINALRIARGATPGLAYSYDLYRQALRDTEFYEERLSRYQEQKNKYDNRMLSPEQNLEESAIQKRTDELYQEYLLQQGRRARRRGLAHESGSDEDASGAEDDLDPSIDLQPTSTSVPCSIDNSDENNMVPCSMPEQNDENNMVSCSIPEQSAGRIVVEVPGTGDEENEL